MNSPGRRALVSGGSGELGAAICRMLARAGHHVYVHANRRAEVARQLAQSITAQGGSAEVLQFDITDAATSRAVLEALVADQPIQILVNNAGITDDAVFAGMSAVQWHRVIDVSVHGFYNVTQPLLLPMIHSRWGRIVNVTSVAALTGNRGQVNYAAAKGALHAATRALALEVASRGVTVNAVAPGIIRSPLADAAFDAARIAQLVPAGRVGEADEVAALVGFLASDRAAYITGQTVSINGGMI